MPDHEKIYNEHAGQYELLVSREDYQRNILRALDKIRPLDGLDVVELGAGTGRLTCMLAPVVKTIRAFDASQHMLDVAIAKLGQSGLQNWRVEVADHRNLPVADQTADVAISGWSICYIVGRHEERWRDELGQVLAEMKRVLRPGGTIIILETLGTGYETPHPPDGLVAYYAFLEEEEGFSSTWMRTDYRFESLAEAEALTCFFFGESMADKVISKDPVILPECTGVWWLRVAGADERDPG
jgi:ubiquinone/menaquinone biosynthesis C-methylase UbiE